jgi:hypothetical protein
VAPSASAPVGPVATALGPGSFTPPVFRFSPLVAVKRAIAYQVLTSLAATAAAGDGHVVSVATARAFAAKEYALWRSHRVTLPPGSPPPVFFTARAVASYRQILTLNAELSIIAGPPTDGSRTPALRRWMTRRLRSDTVAIYGVPGLTAANLAASLPSSL